MIDLHSHILPGMDDGAKSVEESIALLEQCEKEGVRQLALTSHFDCEKEAIESFLVRRDNAYAILNSITETMGELFQFKQGAEVFFSPKLFEMDLGILCLEDTKVLLLELPVGYRPQFFRELLYELQEDGIIPLIAHVERYSYVLDDPRILTEWIDAGAYLQVNASTILRGDKKSKMVLEWIKWGLIHVIASDTHSVEKRPQRLGQAYEVIEKKLGEQLTEQMKQCAHDLFCGEEPEIMEYHCPRRFLGRWI